MAAVVYVVFHLVGILALVVTPVFLALLLTAVLRPPVRWLRDRSFPDWLAALTALGSLIALIAGLAALIVPSFVSQLSELEDSLGAGLGEAGHWLREGPVGLTQAEVDQYVEDIKNYLSEHQAEIAGGVVGGLRTAAQVLVALGLTLVITFFFLKDGIRSATG